MRCRARGVMVALAGVVALMLAPQSAGAAPASASPPAPASAPASILGADAGLDAISCPTPTTCYAGGWTITGEEASPTGVVIGTNNGGITWWYRSDQLGVVTGLACPTTTTCFAAAGGIEASTDGGATWNLEQFTDPSGDGSSDFTKIKCASATTCVATGQDDQQDGVVAWTTDGGATWGSALASTGGEGLSCPSTTLCLSGGSNDYLSTATALEIDRSTDGGATWATTLEYPNPPVTPEDDSIGSISCPTTADCLALGELATYGIDNNPPGPVTPVLYSSVDNGATWTSRPVPADLSASYPYEVDCARVADCYTIGQISAGIPTVEASTNSGWAWHGETLPSDVTGLAAITCPTYFRCYAVGTDNVPNSPSAIVATTDSGQTWTQQTTP